MEFSNILNKYIAILNCTAKELSEESKIDRTLISKYRNGQRKPKADSLQLDNLITGIYNISINKGINLNIEIIKKELESSLTINEINFEVFRNNFNFIISELNISIMDFASKYDIDTSFVYRIKNGQRKPSDLKGFINNFAEYIVIHNQTVPNKNAVGNVIKKDLKNLDNKLYKNTIIDWLINNNYYSLNIINDILKNIDYFNIDEYEKMLNIDISSLPTLPTNYIKSKNYFGIEGFKKAEYDFLKITLLSNSKEPIFLHNEMPLDEILSDPELEKNMIKTISIILKQGIQLNIIHNINRPIQEMFWGLKNWIPVYMFANITPYYLENKSIPLFSQVHLVSGKVALVGECPYGEENKCKLYLTTKKEDIDYYKEKAKILLSNAKPLMEIYKESNKNEFNKIVKSEKNIKIIKNEHFKNIDFYIAQNKWISINKLTSPKMNFVIYNEKLRKALEEFLK